MFSGCTRKFLRMMDGDGMVNNNGIMEGILTGYWESNREQSTDVCKWIAIIENYNLLLLCGGTTVLECSFSFELPKEFNEYNTNIRTELIPELNTLGYEKTVIGTVKQLHTENGNLFLQITYQNGDTGVVVFEKTEEKVEILDGSDTYVDGKELT